MAKHKSVKDVEVPTYGKPVTNSDPSPVEVPYIPTALTRTLERVPRKRKKK